MKIRGQRVIPPEDGEVKKVLTALEHYRHYVAVEARDLIERLEAENKRLREELSDVTSYIGDEVM